MPKHKTHRIKYRHIKKNGDGNRGYVVYPFGRMSKGHWFNAPAEDSHRVSSAAYAYGRRHGHKYRCTTDSKHVRVQRVS